MPVSQYPLPVVLNCAVLNTSSISSPAIILSTACCPNLLAICGNTVLATSTYKSNHYIINYKNLIKNIIMSNKLVYKKIFVNSQNRLPQSASSADFSIELNENFETPEGTRMYITYVSLGAVWKTTEIGFYEYLYVMVYDNSDVLVKCFRHYLGNKIYFAEQFCYDIVEGMNSNTTDFV